MAQHCPPDIREGVLAVTQEAAGSNDLVALSAAFQLAVDTGAILPCRCDICHSFREFYVAEWRRIVARLNEEEIPWGIKARG